MIDVTYDLKSARIVANVKHELRYNAYPNEHSMIQDRLQESCPDIGEIIFSGSHSDNVIIINAKGKNINSHRICATVHDIVCDIYQKYIINKYGKNNEMSRLDPSILFNIITINEQIKVYL